MRKLLVAVALLAACKRAAPPAQPSTPFDIRPAPAVLDASEHGNLLNIALGASVISRTGELTLEQSALRAIDGDAGSTWTSPPGDATDQVLVFALAAPVRAQQAGLQTPRSPLFHVQTAQLDSSLDGVNFTPLATLNTSDRTDDPQFVNVDRDILYLRLTTTKATGNLARINSVQVRGRWAAAPRQAPMTGCWSINDLAAQFANDRGRIIGTLGGEHPVSFEGGSDGLVYRFVWTSGPNRGFAAIDTSPDGKHLSGLRWYEEPMAYSAAESWFGQRSKCGAPIPHEDAAGQFLRLKHRLPLYSLHFDGRGQLIEAESEAALDMIANFARQRSAQRLRLASREYRQGGADANRRLAQARLDSLRSVLQKRGIDAKRFEWQVLGDQNPSQRVETEIQRNLYSAIEVVTQ